MTDPILIGNNIPIWLIIHKYSHIYSANSKLYAFKIKLLLCKCPIYRYSFKNFKQLSMLPLDSEALNIWIQIMVFEYFVSKMSASIEF